MKSATIILSCLAGLFAARMTAATPQMPKMHSNADGTWDSGAYLYDHSGNVRAIGTDVYVYDAAGRVVRGTVKGPANQQQYTYDAFGNRIASQTTSPLGCAGGVACDEAVTVSALTNRITSGAPTYDEAGNVTSLGNGHSTYVYDATGMMTKQTDGANLREYVYTADDQRIAVYSNHEWLWSVRDPAQRVIRDFESHDGSTSFAIAEDYIYDNTGLLGTVSAAGRRHAHRDHLGTIRLITDDAGRRLAEHAYYPFGTELQLAPENPEDRMKFTGHERDTIPGEIHTLDYMHARYYSASMGRFMAVDPADGESHQPQSWNRYAYVRNNPVIFTDPTGRQLYGGDKGDVDKIFSVCMLCEDAGKQQPTTEEFCFICPRFSEHITVTAVDPTPKIRDNSVPLDYRIADSLGGTDILAGILSGDPRPFARGFIKQAEKALTFVVAGGGPKALTVRVSRWGRPGLEAADWVMPGETSYLNYIRSFKWQNGYGNEFAEYESGATYDVHSFQVKWPAGFGLDGWWKGLIPFSQRIFMP